VEQAGSMTHAARKVASLEGVDFQLGSRFPIYIGLREPVRDTP